MERISESEPALGRVSSLEGAGAGQELTTPVGALVTRAPLEVSGETSVAEAARAMREAGTSAAIVGTEPPGILTDRDLRSRVLAEGLSPETPVRAVMSRPLVALPAETPLFEALRRMLDREIHHLPVTRGGQIVAVLGDTDLLRHQARSPLALLDRIEHLQHLDEVSGYSAEVTGVAATLFDLGKTAGTLAPTDVPYFATGFVVSFISALVVVKAFLTYVSNHSFAVFAWYRIAFGAALLWLAR